MLNTYVIEGGIGKCTAFTALIPKLKEKNKSPIQVYTPYLDCFGGNPDVKMAYDEGSIPITDPRIKESDNILYCEPYKSNFQKGSQHIIESYCQHFDVEYTSDMKPKLYTDHLKPRVKEWLEKNKVEGKYVIVQFTGGQTPLGFNPQNQYNNINPGRIYPMFMAQTVINLIKQKYPDLTIIDFSLPNEPSYQNAIKCEEHWAVVHEMLKDSEGFISVDSCLNHFSASTEKSGVVIWGPTRWTQFGYSHNKNLHFHMKNKWDESKFNDSDPRNIMVDPEVVFNAYEKRDTLSKNQTKSVYCSSE